MLREILKQLENKLGNVYKNEYNKFSELLYKPSPDIEECEFKPLYRKYTENTEKFGGNEFRFLNSKYTIIDQARALFNKIKVTFPEDDLKISKNENIVNILENQLDNFTLFNSKYKGKYRKRERLFRKEDKNITEKVLKERFIKLNNYILRVKDSYLILKVLKDFLVQAMSNKKNFDLSIVLESKSKIEINEKLEHNNTLGIDVSKVFNASSTHNRTDKKNSSDTRSKWKQHIETDEEKYYNLLQLLKIISPIVKITLIIDELDKSPKDVLFELLDKHKSLFLDSGLSTIFISDVYSVVELQAFRASYIQDSNIIIVPRLDLYAFIRRLTY